MSQLFKVLLVTIAIALQVCAINCFSDNTDDDLMAEESQFFNGGPKLTFGYFGYFQPHGHVGHKFEFSGPPEYNDYDYDRHGHHRHHHHENRHDAHRHHHAHPPPTPPPTPPVRRPPPPANQKPALTLPPPAIPPTPRKPGRPAPPTMQSFEKGASERAPTPLAPTVAPTVAVIPMPATTQASLPIATVEEEGPLGIDIRIG